LSQILSVQSAEGRNLFQTVRIPVSRFTGVPLAGVQGIKLVFDQSAKGSIIVGAVRATAGGQINANPPAAVAGSGVAAGTPGATPAVQGFVGVGQITDASVAQGAGAHGPNGQPVQAYVDLKVESADHFPARNELPILHIGDKTFDLSGYDNGSQDTLVFKVPVQDFKALQANAPVVVTYGPTATSTYVINAGTLPADILNGIQ
jgi:hypothetical protein